MQESFNFPVTFSVNYLAVPNNLLTHTHTHTHKRTVAKHTSKHFPIRARKARRNLNRQRIISNSSCLFFHARSPSITMRIKHNKNSHFLMISESYNHEII